MQPRMILVRPQMGENIGASARAMANFGLSDMGIVNPRDGWPNVKAADTAGKALYVLDDARITQTLAEAVADCQFVLATTSRERAMNLPVMDAREAMAEVASRCASGQRCAVLFGAERTGLENEEIMVAQGVVTIPVSAQYASLNLSHAVSVLAYEWMMAQANTPSPKEHAPAPHEALEGLFAQLEAELDASGFWSVAEKKPTMWRNIRASLLRAEFSEQEVATWRGIIRALVKK